MNVVFFAYAAKMIYSDFLFNASKLVLNYKLIKNQKLRKYFEDN